MPDTAGVSGSKVRQGQDSCTLHMSLSFCSPESPVTGIRPAYRRGVPGPAPTRVAESCGKGHAWSGRCELCSPLHSPEHPPAPAGSSPFSRASPSPAGSFPGSPGISRCPRIVSRFPQHPPVPWASPGAPGSFPCPPNIPRHPPDRSPGIPQPGPGRPLAAQSGAARADARSGAAHTRYRTPRPKAGPVLPPCPVPSPAPSPAAPPQLGRKRASQGAPR